MYPGSFRFDLAAAPGALSGRLREFRGFGHLRAERSRRSAVQALSGTG
jgi:hypothetical protein